MSETVNNEQTSCAGENALKMGQISKEFLDQLALTLKEQSPTEQTVQALRQQFPAVRFILCSEDDMAEREPFMAFDEFVFYLMAGHLGCATLTDDVEKSVGVVVATIEE